MESGCFFSRASSRDAFSTLKKLIRGFGLAPALLVLPLVFPPHVEAGGRVNPLSQSDLESAMAEGGVVTFGASGTLVLSNTIHVLRDTTLRADGESVVLSGGDSIRLFAVASNVSFHVEGLVLANGRVAVPAPLPASPPIAGSNTRGAAILNVGGNVSLSDCILTNHFVRGGDAGTDTAQQGGAPGGSGHGAAIWSFGGELRLTNSVVGFNRVEGGLGSSATFGLAAASGTAAGAGIYVEHGSVDLDGVEFAGNIAEGGAPVGGDGMVGNAGKAGEALGAALFVTNSVATIVRCRITSNYALGGSSPVSVSHGQGSGHAYGGGFFLDSDSVAEVRSSVFTNNAAIAGFGRRNEPGGNSYGGAVYAEGGLSVFNSTFITNRAEGGNSRYPGTARGGAICTKSILSLTGSEFDHNEAKAGSFGLETNVAGEGGALWCAGQLFMTNSTFAANKAVGGWVSPAPIGVVQGGPARGGAIVFQGATGILVNATLSGNTAEPGLSPETLPPATAEGGALFSTNSQVTVRSSIFAHSLSGGGIAGPVIDAGYNIASDGSAGFSAQGSFNNTDPMLAGLALKGGETATMGLLVGSPARDAIPTGYPDVDQRGTSRPQGPAADIGAFEADFISAQPSIFLQPRSQTVRIGTDVILAVGAAGTPPLNYHWQKDGQTIAGARDAEYSLTNIQPAQAGTYSVVVSNAAGSASSRPATLIVSAEPLILYQPLPVEVSPGQSATFRVTAEGPGLGYQWSHDGVPISGATNATLDIATALAGSQGKYHVVVTNFAGEISSAPAVLSFDATALSILVPPASRSVELGYSTVFEVLAAGVPPFSYQWFHDGVQIPGATNISYTLAAGSTNDAGAYNVVVTNAFRAVTSPPAVLTVRPGAARPLIDIAWVGSSITLTFEAQAGRTYRLLSSTNLVDWSLIGATSVVGAGPLQFVEPIMTNRPTFYRIITP